MVAAGDLKRLCLGVCISAPIRYTCGEAANSIGYLDGHAARIGRSAFFE
jgi:hypothetical protein